MNHSSVKPRIWNLLGHHRGKLFLHNRPSRFALLHVSHCHISLMYSSHQGYVCVQTDLIGTISKLLLCCCDNLLTFRQHLNPMLSEAL